MTGWDKYLPGHGMLVWQIVYDASDWYFNQPNNKSIRMKLLAANGSAPYTKNMDGGARQDVPFPGSWNVTEYEPYAHVSLTEIEEENGVVRFQFTNGNYTHVLSPSVGIEDGQWYNLLGMPVDDSYQGIVIRKGEKRVR